MPQPWERPTTPTRQPWERPDSIPASKGEVLPPAGGDAPTLTPSKPDLQHVSLLPGAASDIGHDVGDLFAGVGSGLANTTHGVGSALAHVIPANSSYGKDFGAGLDEFQDLSQTRGPIQAIGKGLEQAGEFLLPGGAEEKAASLVPKVLRPMARIGAAAIGSGLVNKAQGGSFTGGAVAGGAAGALGAGAKAIAPKLAESALGITKADRAFGKTPGNSILEETRGFQPSSIEASGRTRLNELTPQLESAVDRASARPTPIRGFLPAPSEELPLHSSAPTEGRLSKPITIDAPGRPMRPQLAAPKLETPMSSHADIFPDQLPSGTTTAGPEPIAHPGMGPGQFVGEIPGERGGPGEVQGVLRRPFQAPAGGAPISPTVPNRVFSMGPARDVVSGAMGKAARENASSLHGQLGEMSDFLGRRFNSGEAIPDELTPRQGLDLKRGFATEFLGRWNPETHGGTLSTARGAYHALDSELDRTVPEAAELNQRISSLIPVVHRAESVSRNALPAQLMMRRIAAPTGALVGPIFGGSEGYRQGGVPGAIAGAGLGLAAPLALTTPLGQMIMARGLNSAGAPAARYLGGGALQAARWMSHRGTGDQGQ